MSHAEPAAPTVDRGRIPGPRGLEVWRVLATLRDRPHERLLNLALEYGDIVLLDFKTERVVILAKPEYVEHVLHFSHQKYDKQTARWKSLRQMFGHGLLTSDGDLWRRQRQRMQPAFHQSAIRGFATIVTEETQRIASDWADTSTRGETRDVYRDMIHCTVRAITRASFGADVEGKIESLIEAVEEINEYVNPLAPMNLLRIPLSVQRVINPEYRRFRRAYAAIDRVFSDIVTQRLSAPPTDATGMDLLGMSIQGRDDETSQPMAPRQLRDEMAGILMAGHETTAIGLTWSWYWLSQNPAAERRLHEELDTVLAGRLPAVDDLEALPYTRMVFQEALRLTPPVWGYDRRAREDDWIDGYRIRRGMNVALVPYLLHRHPKYWENPEAFDPLRFEAATADARPEYAYFPFGGGPRRCIGMRFAMLEGPMVLAILAQAFSARVKPGHKVEPKPQLNFPPRLGMPMLLTRRPVTTTSTVR